MDGQTVILAVKCNVHDMLFLHGNLLVMLVSESLLFALAVRNDLRHQFAK
jgi:hypothetical protein